ncbi:pyrroline-5-carboxylate reductase, partial [Candidatus Gracilibacteria bacterium]|nr:pyrroline-5-carboxylate reductase [Candidatus Gracilibacteria bacterium]
MLRDVRVAVVGPGAMGEAVIGGLLRKELVAAEQILVSHPREERL